MLTAARAQDVSDVQRAHVADHGRDGAELQQGFELMRRVAADGHMRLGSPFGAFIDQCSWEAIEYLYCVSMRRSAKACSQCRLEADRLRCSVRQFIYSVVHQVLVSADWKPIGSRSVATLSQAVYLFSHSSNTSQCRSEADRKPIGCGAQPGSFFIESFIKLVVPQDYFGSWAGLF